MYKAVSKTKDMTVSPSSPWKFASSIDSSAPMPLMAETSASTDHVDLYEALSAVDDAALRLPAASTFEPLTPRATAAQLEDTDMFASHATYELPCSSGGPRVDCVHRFTLARGVSDPLNASLGAWCERKAEAATEYGRLVRTSLPPELADAALRVRRAGSAAGVRLSNQGGFQSYHDLFSPQEGKKRKHSYRHCRKVRPRSSDPPPSATLPSSSRAHGHICCVISCGSSMSSLVSPWTK